MYRSRILDILARWADIRVIFDLLKDDKGCIEIDGPFGIYTITNEKSGHTQFICMHINCETDKDLPDFIFDETDDILMELKRENEVHRESWRTTANHYEARGDEIQAKTSWDWVRYHDDIVEQCNQFSNKKV